MSKLIINEFKEDYIKVPLYNNKGEFISELDRNQLLDVRTQIYLNRLDGYYVIFPSGEKGIINSKDGTISNFPDNLWRTTIDLARKLNSFMVNDIRNQNKIVE